MKNNGWPFGYEILIDGQAIQSGGGVFEISTVLPISSGVHSIGIRGFGDDENLGWSGNAQLRLLLSEERIDVQ